MNIEKIEQIIKLVKENDVKKFKFKNFEEVKSHMDNVR